MLIRDDGRGFNPKPGASVLFVSDAHAPFTDEGALAVTLQAIRDLEPDYLIDMGDASDFESITRHEPSPNSPKLTLRQELRSSRELRRRLTAAADDAMIPPERRFYLEGNHEYRYLRWLLGLGENERDFMPATVPEFLGLDEFGWKWIPNSKQLYRMGQLYLHHGHWYPIHHAKKHADELGVDNVYGHTHRAQQHSRRFAGGVITATGLPTLRDLDAPWHHMYRREFHGWSAGFGYATFDDNLKASVQNVIVHDGVAAFAGHHWNAAKLRKRRAA